MYIIFPHTFTKIKFSWNTTFDYDEDNFVGTFMSYSHEIL